MIKKHINLLIAIVLSGALVACGQTPKKESPATPEKGFSFAFFTDVHLNKDNHGNGSEGLRQALVNAKNKGVDLVLFGGDNTDSDGLGDAEQTADSLQAHFKNMVDQGGIPAHFTIGNHDRYYLNKGEPDTLGFKLFEKHFGETYRSFTHKGVHFISLNSLFPKPESPYSVNSEQLDWLKNDLQQTGKETPIVVSIHVPFLSLYYPVVEGNFKALDMIWNTKEVFEVLNEYNVKLILQGHQHIYEQIQERNRWFITGGAISAYWWGGAFLETEEGYLLVHVDTDNNFSWEYIDYEWDVKKSDD